VRTCAGSAIDSVAHHAEAAQTRFAQFTLFVWQTICFINVP
jgi:hypothetical protein